MLRAFVVKTPRYIGIYAIATRSRRDIDSYYEALVFIMRLKSRMLHLPCLLRLF